MLIYYAHCKAIYDTLQEERDITVLEKLGFEVLNPNDAKHKPNWEEKGMAYADFLVGSCDGLAFRALPGGILPAGVAKEVEIAKNLNIPIFELPNFSLMRTLDLPQTRQYLTDVGQR